MPEASNLAFSWPRAAEVSPAVLPAGCPFVAPDLALLHGSRLGTHLRWRVEGGVSFRSYEVTSAREDWTCVTSGSTELTLLLEGECWLVIGPRQQQLRVRPGEGFVVHHGTPHGLHAAAGTHFVVLDLPSPESELQGISLFGAADLPLLVERRLPHLWEQSRPLLVPDLEGWVRDLLARPAARRLVPVESAQSTNLMLAVKRALDRRYTEPVGISELARQFSLDRFYLARQFKLNFQMSPVSYLRLLRVEHFVWSMLLQGNQGKTHTEVAGESGFGDYSTFSRDIRQQLGVPPSRLVRFGNSGPRLS